MESRFSYLWPLFKSVNTAPLCQWNPEGQWSQFLRQSDYLNHWFFFFIKPKWPQRSANKQNTQINVKKKKSLHVWINHICSRVIGKQKLWLIITSFLQIFILLLTSQEVCLISIIIIINIDFLCFVALLDFFLLWYYLLTSFTFHCWTDCAVRQCTNCKVHRIADCYELAGYRLCVFPPISIFLNQTHNVSRHTWKLHPTLNRVKVPFKELLPLAKKKALFSLNVSFCVWMVFWASTSLLVEYSFSCNVTAISALNSVVYVRTTATMKDDGTTPSGVVHKKTVCQDIWCSFSRVSVAPCDGTDRDGWGATEVTKCRRTILPVVMW